MGLDDRVGLRISGDDGALVKGDATQIRQVVINLVSNAAKYTDDGEVRLTARSADRGIVIDVEGGNNLMYLPLDALMRGRTAGLPDAAIDIDRSQFGPSQPSPDVPLSSSSSTRRSRSNES